MISDGYCDQLFNSLLRIRVLPFSEERFIVVSLKVNGQNAQNALHLLPTFHEIVVFDRELIVFFLYNIFIGFN